MRLESKVKVTRLLKYSMFLYIVISLFYTTNHYFTTHAPTEGPTSREQEIQERLKSLPKPELQHHQIALEQHQQVNYHGQVAWPGSKGKNKDFQNKQYAHLSSLFIIFLFVGSDEIHTLSEQLVRSKIFSVVWVSIT